MHRTYLLTSLIASVLVAPAPFQDAAGNATDGITLEQAHDNNADALRKVNALTRTLGTSLMELTQLGNALMSQPTFDSGEMTSITLVATLFMSAFESAQGVTRIVPVHDAMTCSDDRIVLRQFLREAIEYATGSLKIDDEQITHQLTFLKNVAVVQNVIEAKRTLSMLRLQLLELRVP